MWYRSSASCSIMRLCHLVLWARDDIIGCCCPIFAMLFWNYCSVCKVIGTDKSFFLQEYLWTNLANWWESVLWSSNRLALMVAGGLVLASFMTYASEHLAIRAFLRGLEDRDAGRSRSTCSFCWAILKLTKLTLKSVYSS